MKKLMQPNGLVGASTVSSLSLINWPLSASKRQYASIFWLSFVCLQISNTTIVISQRTTMMSISFASQIAKTRLLTLDHSLMEHATTRIRRQRVTIGLHPRQLHDSTPWEMRLRSRVALSCTRSVNGARQTSLHGEMRPVARGEQLEISKVRIRLKGRPPKWISWQLTDKWTSVSELLNENSFLLNSVDFYGHNDWDMLVTSPPKFRLS